MVAALAPERLEIHIDRPIDPVVAATDDDRELTGDGTRTITLVPVGSGWTRRVSGLQ